MASRDHKARSRPSFPDNDTLTEPSGAPFSTAEASASFHPADRIDIAIAVLTLVRLRCDSERYRKARAWGLPAKPLEFPLSAEVTAALSMAIDCLEQLAFGHVHLSSVNT